MRGLVFVVAVALASLVLTVGGFGAAPPTTPTKRRAFVESARPAGQQVSDHLCGGRTGITSQWKPMQSWGASPADATQVEHARENLEERNRELAQQREKLYHSTDPQEVTQLQKHALVLQDAIRAAQAQLDVMRAGGEHEDAIYVDVDARHCGFKQTPVYIASLVSRPSSLEQADHAPAWHHQLHSHTIISESEFGFRLVVLKVQPGGRNDPAAVLAADRAAAMAEMNAKLLRKE